jgi:hypothetical protein
MPPNEVTKELAESSATSAFESLATSRSAADARAQVAGATVGASALGFAAALSEKPRKGGTTHTSRAAGGREPAPSAGRSASSCKRADGRRRTVTTVGSEKGRVNDDGKVERAIDDGGLGGDEIVA